MLLLEKIPPLICALEVFQFLNEVQGNLDLFEFFERLQVIIDRN